MNTAMQIMSAQHQLVLAILEGTELSEMLHHFLQVSSARLNATNSHIFIFQDADHNPTYQPQKKNDDQLAHYLSLPIQKNGIPWSESQTLTNIIQQFYLTNLANQVIEFESSLYHCFKISDFGVLTIQRIQPLEREIQRALAPVLEKLAASCISSMVHQTLRQEIKTRQDIEQQNQYQASHDYLTGLCNRIELERRLKRAITSCVDNHHQGVLLLIDLVSFKNINDVMGHHVGDKVLCQIACRLKELTEKHDTVARFGGDEFIILLRDLPSDVKEVDSILNTMIIRIINAIETPFEVAEGTFSLSCFIGYERFINAEKSVHDIIKNANIAMYEAIKKGQEKALPYHSTMSDLLNQRINYTAEIKQALTDKEFELHYQPQFDHLGHMVGAEALLRWNNPLRGYESPALYIPIAEESDLILQIGNFVLDQACEDIYQLEQMQLPRSFAQISVNVSAKQLSRADFVDIVIEKINRYKISPSRLKIEITESIMMGDIDLSISHLQKLRQFGVQCAIDDFGTGYSSLAYLRRLPASLLKIDRVFVTDLDKDEGNKAIASMIIGLGKRLNMQVIAEGVENQQQLDCLISLGCYQYQGYYFSRPLPFTQLITDIGHQLNLKNRTTQ